MKKIIHLSDLHIGYGDCGDRFGRVIERMTEYFTNPKDYVVVITGDIVNESKENEQLTEAKGLLSTLKDKFQVLFVPGNHDCGKGNVAKKKYFKRFCEELYEDENITFPLLGDPKSQGLIEGVAFLGLDSMEQEIEDRDYLFGAQGKIGANQLDKLDAKLKELKDDELCEKVVVYLHHHPFKLRSNHGLQDVAAFHDVLVENGNVDCLLFGHNHNGLNWNGSWGIERCYDAGSATRKNGDNGCHRVIELNKKPLYDFDGDFHNPRVVEDV